MKTWMAVVASLMVMAMVITIGTCSKTEEQLHQDILRLTRSHSQLQEELVLQENEAFCKTSSACKDHGKCTYDAAASSPSREIIMCGAASDEECQQSTLCRENGQCKAQGGVCLATAESCRKSLMCRKEGRCILDVANGECLAKSPYFCSISEDCKKKGACSPWNDFGNTWKCVATSKAECQNSFGCIENGLCAISERQCSPTHKCRPQDCDNPERTLCSWMERRCVLGSTIDCQKSRDCKVWGLCVVIADLDNGCVATKQGCRKSLMCRKEGYCTKRGYPCIVGSADDCKKSEACKQEDRCQMGTGFTWQSTTSKLNICVAKAKQ